MNNNSFEHRLNIVLNETVVTDISPHTDDDLSPLYHATNIRNVPRISEIGLDPSESSHAEDEESNNWDKGPPYHFVYLTPEIHVVKKFAPGGEHHEDKNNSNGAVFAVRLPAELQGKLILDRGEFIRAPFVIDPKYLERIR